MVREINVEKRRDQDKKRLEMFYLSLLSSPDELLFYIGILDGCQSMSNDDSSLVYHDSVNYILHQVFILCI